MGAPRWWGESPKSQHHSGLGPNSSALERKEKEAPRALQGDWKDFPPYWEGWGIWMDVLSAQGKGLITKPQDTSPISRRAQESGQESWAERGVLEAPICSWAGRLRFIDPKWFDPKIQKKLRVGLLRSGLTALRRRK